MKGACADRHEKFSACAAPLISGFFRELARKTGGLKHTPKTGLAAAHTTKIFLLSCLAQAPFHAPTYSFSIVKSFNYVNLRNLIFT